MIGYRRNHIGVYSFSFQSFFVLIFLYPRLSILPFIIRWPGVFSFLFPLEFKSAVEEAMGRRQAASGYQLSFRSSTEFIFFSFSSLLLFAYARLGRFERSCFLSFVTGLYISGATV